MKIISLFSGVGGLDKGFEQAGFEIIWANESDRLMHGTYKLNHKSTHLDTRFIVNIPLVEVPKEIWGIIGYLPSQSWTLEYLRFIRGLNPTFFFIDTVPEIFSFNNINNHSIIISLFEKCGYSVSYKIVNAFDYGVPQIKKRVIIIGYRNILNTKFDFEKVKKEYNKRFIKDAISDLPEPLPAVSRHMANNNLPIPNHEYIISGFSDKYMMINRKSKWDEASLPINTNCYYIPLHPASAPLIQKHNNLWKFNKNTDYPYRRLSVRECARIQTFPDDFEFVYKNLKHGYKMVGSSIPVLLAAKIAQVIYKDMTVLYSF